MDKELLCFNPVIFLVLVFILLSSVGFIGIILMGLLSNVSLIVIVYQYWWFLILFWGALSASSLHERCVTNKVIIIFLTGSHNWSLGRAHWFGLKNSGYLSCFFLWLKCVRKVSKNKSENTIWDAGTKRLNCFFLLSRSHLTLKKWD